MKIAHVIHGFPPHNNAGAETYTYKLALEQAHSHEVSIFHRIGDATAPEYEVKREKREGLDVWSINSTLVQCKSYELTYTNPPIVEAFANFLDEVKPDVVHIGHLLLLSTLIADELQRRKIPTVMTLHDYWPICPRGQLIDNELRLCLNPNEAKCDQCQLLQIRISAFSHTVFSIYKKITSKLHLGDNFMRGLLRRIYLLVSGDGTSGKDSVGPIEKRRQDMREALNKIDILIAPSNFLREQYISFGVDPKKILYSDYGFDTAPFEDFQHSPANKIRFGFVGSIIPTKGLHVLLEAFDGIDTKKAELNIFGGFTQFYEFDDYPQLIKKAADNPGINMRGSYLAHEIAGVFAEIDVMVVPSIWYENSPLVIHEAFMANTPVITSKSGGMAELVQHEVSGLLFEQDNAESLRDAIKKITDDSALIEKLRAGIPSVKTIEDDAENIVALYTRLLENH